MREFCERFSLLGADVFASSVCYMNRDEGGESELPEGTVKWFSGQKGYGFISQDDGPDVFVHHSAIAGGGSETLSENDRVRFDTVEGPKGLKAENVVKL